MKCPNCDGSGIVNEPIYNKSHTLIKNWAIKKCDMCNGSGEYIGEPMTNEEWLHTLNTEEKAFALETIIRSVLVQRPPMCHDVCNREFWERWLKEKHE